MEQIINQIMSILEKNNISIYSLARSTNISKSTLYKILHFDRTMKPKHFYAILEYLPVSYEIKRELSEQFRGVALGNNDYGSFNYIASTLKDFSDISFSIDNRRFTPPSSEMGEKEEYSALYKGDSVGQAISLSLISAASKSGSRVNVYLPANGSKILSEINNMLRVYETDMRLVFFIDLVNNSSEENLNRNLSILRSIVPIALCTDANLEFYYTYVDSLINKSYLTPYPYFISLSDRVLFINADLSEIMIVKNEIIAQNIAALCDGKLTHYNRLVNINQNVMDMVSSLVNATNEITTHYCIEYEPCLSMFFCEAMIDEIVPPSVPAREQLIALLNYRLAQLKKITSSIQVFNKDSLLHFARTGEVAEFPKEYAIALSVDARKYVLNALISAMQSGEYTLRALNPVYFQISDCLSLVIIDDSCLQFSIFNDRKLKMRYITINEPLICRCYLDFIKSICDTNMVYSQKESIAFAREALAVLDKI